MDYIGNYMEFRIVYVFYVWLYLNLYALYRNLYGWYMDFMILYVFFVYKIVHGFYIMLYGFYTISYVFLGLIFGYEPMLEILLISIGPSTKTIALWVTKLIKKLPRNSP